LKVQGNPCPFRAAQGEPKLIHGTIRREGDALSSQQLLLGIQDLCLIHLEPRDTGWQLEAPWPGVHPGTQQDHLCADGLMGAPHGAQEVFKECRRGLEPYGGLYSLVEEHSPEDDAGDGPGSRLLQSSGRLSFPKSSLHGMDEWDERMRLENGAFHSGRTRGVMDMMVVVYRYAR